MATTKKSKTMIHATAEAVRGALDGLDHVAVADHKRLAKLLTLVRPGDGEVDRTAASQPIEIGIPRLHVP